MEFGSFLLAHFAPRTLFFCRRSLHLLNHLQAFEFCFVIINWRLSIRIMTMDEI